jgi:ribosomal protein L16 Arg81 hydroxylase
MTAQSQWPQIEHRRGLGRDEFIEEYMRKSRPVVIQGIADDWIHRWTPTSLKERFGDREVEAETGQLFINERKKKKLKLSELIDDALNASLEYRLRSFSLLSEVQELQDEYKAHNHYEEYFDQDRSGRLRNAFWISPPGNRTVLHNDGFYENINVQVYGHKRFLLMPPSDYPRMHSHFLAESAINPLNPDFERFPRFAKARIQEATLEPGEVIYLPQFWWHYVVAQDFTINVNTFMRTSFKSMWRATKAVPLVPRTVYRTMHNERIARFIDRTEKRLYQVYTAVSGKKKLKESAATS